MKKLFVYGLGIIVISFLGYSFFHTSEIKYVVSNTENILASSTTTPSTQNKFHILIVPGHEPDYGGTDFKSPYGKVYERDFTVELGQDLKQYLDSDVKYQVDITRDITAWTPAFADYFKNNWDAISAWVTVAKKSPTGSVISTGVAPEIHNNTPKDVALRLYGITKWSNDNAVNLMVHIHFNNYPNNPPLVAGKYSGFVMYIPSAQYANSSSTLPIAQAVYKRLALYNPKSNLKVESAGIIADPELIAVGSDNTSNAASMLIEYEYIYEPQLVNPATRSLAMKDLAYQTYLGLKDYFDQNQNISTENGYNPSTLYTWNSGTNKNSTSTDIYALQTALIMDGDYPPAGKTKNDCPHSGSFGACTVSALSAFQKKNNIVGENGIVGQKSFDILGAIYNGNK